MNLKTFCIDQHINYQEINVENEIFNKFYEIINPNNDAITAIPDGCIDVQFLWKNGEVEVHVCGSFLEVGISRTGNYDKCFGIKFNPGVVPNCVKDNVEEVVNNRYILKSHDHIRDMLLYVQQDHTLQDKANFFINRYAISPLVESNAITDYIIDKIKAHHGAINIGKLTQMTGYSHCYNNRIFKKTTGMTIKRYASILKVQQAIECIRNSGTDEIYELLGYYDQAHFINEFKKFTSFTPKKYMKNIDNIRIV